MPKYKKKLEKSPSKEEKIKQVRNRDEFIIISSIKSFYLAGVCFVVSVLFNAGILTFLMNQNIILDILDVSIKSISIILFFLFLCIAVGNIEEINGKVLGWKQLAVIAAISLLQSIRSGWVALISSIGVALVILYLWIIQEGSWKISSDKFYLY